MGSLTKWPPKSVGPYMFNWKRLHPILRKTPVKHRGRFSGCNLLFYNKVVTFLYDFHSLILIHLVRSSMSISFESCSMWSSSRTINTLTNSSFKPGGGQVVVLERKKQAEYMQTKTVLAYYANYTISILCKITWFAWTPAQFGGHLVQLKLRPTCHSTLEEGKINKQTKEGVGNLAPAYKKKIKL